MIFSLKNPLLTDPEHGNQEDYLWGQSNEPGTYYSWVQYISPAVQLSGKPSIVEISNGIELQMFKGPNRQEMLYRVKFKGPKPTRVALKPAYCLFLSFGHEGGSSSQVKYWYKDKFMTILEWPDKKSYLAILRQQNYLKDEHRFWSRQQS